MKNAFSILIILLYPLKEEAFAQTKNNLSNLTVEEAFRPKMPTRMDTLYFPFYNGMQMIEVDHIGFWDKKIYFLEQSQPRAMPHAMFNPMPIGNEFFFRDTSGTIVKAFNTKHSLSALTNHFKNVPIRKKSNSFWGLLSPYHRNQRHREGIWYQSPQRMLDFHGLYKVSTGHAEQNSTFNDGSNVDKNSDLKFGLIDSLGNVVIPIEYTTIIPFYNYLLVQMENKWGLINYENKVIVTLSYDNYEFDQHYEPFEASKMATVFFLSSKIGEDRNQQFIFKAVFSTQKNKLIKLNDYDEINHANSWSPMEDASKRFIFVEKNGKKGLLNEDYQEIVPPRFEIFELIRNSKGLFRVSKAGKFGFFDRTFKEIIPFDYDYAERFQPDSTALVLKNGAFYRINTKNKKQLKGNLTPEWKTGGLNFVTDKNFISVKTGDFFGIFDSSTTSMILPFVYNKSITPNLVNHFSDENEATFKEKKLELVDKPDMIDELLFYQNKIIVKNVNNQYGVIDSAFKVLIDFNYDNLESIPSELNYLLYLKNGKKGVMDYTEKDFFKESYEEIRYDNHYEQERDIFKVRQNGKWGVINFEQKILLPFEYDSIKFLGHWNRPKIKLWVVEKNKIFGVVDENNKIFIPFIYKGISHLEGNNLWVIDENKVRYKVVLGK